LQQVFVTHPVVCQPSSVTYVTKPERQKPFGRPRLRKEDNIKVNLKDMWC
jgi:hypothetical protein